MKTELRGGGGGDGDGGVVVVVVVVVVVTIFLAHSICAPGKSRLSSAVEYLHTKRVNTASANQRHSLQEETARATQYYTSHRGGELIG